MGWEQLELEELAAELRRMACVESDEIVSALTMAKRILGVPVRVLGTLPTQACLTHDEAGRYRITIRRLEPESHFAVAHELGHWALREIAQADPPNEEELANRIAAALCVPSTLAKQVTKGVRRSHQFRPLAKATGVSETSAALRLRDLQDEARAVVTSRRRNLLGGFVGLEAARAIRLADEQESDPEIVTVRLRDVGIDSGRVQLFSKHAKRA